jgi:hypothetical protein
MGKQRTKQVFGVPSPEVIGATENAQTVNEIRTANFRYEAQLRELERQFEAKAGELRQAYLDEVRGIWRIITSGPAKLLQGSKPVLTIATAEVPQWLRQALPHLAKHCPESR